jgi:hypothetical protein
MAGQREDRAVRATAARATLKGLGSPARRGNLVKCRRRPGRNTTRMPSVFRQLEASARTQAALASDPRAREALLEIAEEYRIRAENEECAH